MKMQLNFFLKIFWYSAKILMIKYKEQNIDDM